MDNRVRLIGICILLVVVIAAVIFFIPGKNSPGNESQKEWPQNELTEEVPEYEGDIYKVSVTNRSTAVFADNVELQEADSYCAKLISEGYKLSSESYPKTAENNDRFITVAYDKDSKKLSVTITLSGEESLIKENK